MESNMNSNMKQTTSSQKIGKLVSRKEDLINSEDKEPDIRCKEIYIRKLSTSKMSKCGK